MPLLTIVNLLSSPVPVQDPSGLSNFSVTVPASGTLANLAITLDQLAHLEHELIAMATASRITWAVADDPASQADSVPAHIATVLTTPYTAAKGDQVIFCKLTVPAAVSVVLAAGAPIGQSVDVIDGTGDASSRNITVTAAGGGTINGGASLVISSNSGVVRFFKITATTWIAFYLSPSAAAPSGAAGGVLAGTYPNPATPTVADANVLGNVALFHRILVAAGANGNTDVVLTNKERVLFAWYVMKGAGTAGSTLAINNGATAITESADVSAKADKATAPFASIDDAQFEIAAAGTLRVVKASTGADFPGAEVYVITTRVA